MVGESILNRVNSIYNENVQGPQNTFFLENALKKRLNIFTNFFFLFESTILPLNNRK